LALAGSSGKGRNFVETMLKKAAAGDAIRVVDDQVLTPTYAKAVRELIVSGKFELYHISSEGESSWYDFTRHIFKCANMSSDFANPVKRPAYSVLSKAKVQALGVSMPSWKDALPRYLEKRSARGLPAPAIAVPANR
jgi:dTDP-4-dehydrorhamnose reductase